jgi:hypothetical protein
MTLSGSAQKTTYFPGELYITRNTHGMAHGVAEHSFFISFPIKAGVSVD